jgi:hypothetical protein
MDTSPEFILMCRKALLNLPLPKEINQGQWLVWVGHKVSTNIDPDAPFCVGREVLGIFDCPDYIDHVTVFDGYDGKEIYKPEDFIPIWTQDQLQEMVKGCSEKYSVVATTQALCYQFADFMRFTDYVYIIWFKTMEQLWLAFTMLTLYQKKWDGKEWVKE